MGAAVYLAAALLLARMETTRLDQIDRAQELDQIHTDAALAAHQRHHRPARAPLSNFCRCCGEEIPRARREAVPDARTCITCQSEIEGERR
jgi:phage/conjugal plasmid C-4 type zinc finger TraR family protein